MVQPWRRTLVVMAFLLAPATAQAAGYGPPAFDSGEAIAAFVNFAIFAGLIYLMLGKPARTYFAERRSRLLADMEDAARLKEAAEQQLAVYGAKLEQFEQERAQILREFREIGEMERDRLVQEGKAQAERMKADATRQVEAEVRVLRQALVKRLVEDAVGEARQEIRRRMTPDAQQRLVEERLRTVAEDGRAQAN